MAASVWLWLVLGLAGFGLGLGVGLELVFTWFGVCHVSAWVWDLAGVGFAVELCLGFGFGFSVEFNEFNEWSAPCNILFLLIGIQHEQRYFCAQLALERAQRAPYNNDMHHEQC